MPEPIAVYVHIPFCPSKCGYCDFNSYAMDGDIMARTTRATIAEIRRTQWSGRRAKTIFFGGGTPTFIPSEQLASILDAVFEVHPPIDGCEITSEANPGTVDAARFKNMRQAGFNRISLGAQSFKNDDLLRLGRIHSSGEIERAFTCARDAGFENINLDLMFALPSQSRAAWDDNLRRALALEPQHLSLYCLTIEPSTPFYKEHLKGRLDLPDDEAQVAMYDLAIMETATAGYRQYEISNFAKPGFECRHNLCYWRCEEYAGYGPGAVGCVSSGSGRMVRYTNLKHPERYCDAAEAGLPLAYESETLDAENLRLERIMLGLRLNEGLCMELAEVSPGALEKVISRGWLEINSGRAILTDAGRHFCSEAVLMLA